MADTTQDSDSLTAVDYLSSQMSLEREARALMPWDPKKCTYIMGPTRQQLYACLDCYNRTGKMAGICYSCSIQCHADHNLVELFTKHHFTCDCGTARTQYPCSLRYNVKDDIESSSNLYNNNFKGQFCDCDRNYNPMEETGNMLQCILGDVCTEDWFHDYCIMGLPKFDPPKKENVKGENVKGEKEEGEERDDGGNLLSTLGEPGLDAETTNAVKKEEANEGDDEEDDEDEAESAIDGFPRFDDFDCFICWKCVAKHREFFDKIKDDDNIVADIVQRIEAPTIEERNVKIKEQQGFFNNALKKRRIQYDYSILLKPGHEQAFVDLFDKSQDDPIVIKFLKEFNLLMKDDPIYEPPADEDDDDASSIYDLGSRAINSLPREQAITGVQAYEDIKSKLKDFFTPFAQDGKVVKQEDIESFFSKLKESKRK